MKDFLNFKLMDKADDLGGAQPSEPAEPETEEAGEPDKPKAKYTDEDVDNIVKAKLAKEREKTAAKVEEAAKLAKMNADQKKDYEAQQVLKRAEEAESKLAQLEMQAEARTMVSDLGVNLTDEDLALVVTTDADSTKTNVSRLTDLIGRIQDQVKTEMLKGTTPKASGQSTTVATADDFSKMSTSERVTFARENPDKFKEYTGGL